MTGIHEEEGPSFVWLPSLSGDWHFSCRYLCVKFFNLFYRSQRQSPKIACAGRCDDTLYPVKIICTEATDSANEGNVRIHYVGYSASYDEWRPCDDVVNFVSSSISEEFCLHNELALRVKSSLVSQRRSNPAV